MVHEKFGRFVGRPTRPEVSFEMFSQNKKVSELTDVVCSFCLGGANARPKGWFLATERATV